MLGVLALLLTIGLVAYVVGVVNAPPNPVAHPVEVPPFLGHLCLAQLPNDLRWDLDSLKSASAPQRDRQVQVFLHRHTVSKSWSSDRVYEA